MAKTRMEQAIYYQRQVERGRIGGITSAQARVNRPSTDPQPTASASASAVESKSKATRAAPAFVRPTIEEVKTYCQERAKAGHRAVDPQNWFDHYTANGWKVGPNAMKDWRAAVRTWERMEHGGNASAVPISAPVSPLASCMAEVRRCFGTASLPERVTWEAVEKRAEGLIEAGRAPGEAAASILAGLSEAKRRIA